MFQTIEGILPVATQEMVSDPRLLQPRSLKSSICMFMGKMYINPFWQKY